MKLNSVPERVSTQQVYEDILLMVKVSNFDDLWDSLESYGDSKYDRGYEDGFDIGYDDGYNDN